MCASKTSGYQGFKSFAAQNCATLKPGESYEQRATKFSSMGSRIIAPPVLNRVGRHSHESVAMQNGQLVQPEHYHLPDRRGVSVNEKRPEAKPFITPSTYQRDFPAYDEERRRVLRLSLEDYETAFLTVAKQESPQQQRQTIRLAQVPTVLQLALGDAAVPRVVSVFVKFLDRRGSERDFITWDLFCQAVDHADDLFEYELTRGKATGSASSTHGAWSAGHVASAIQSSTPHSSYRKDFGGYGDNPRERPYMRKRGMASTTSDLNPGTSRATNQMPGYSGFLPLTTHNPQAVTQASGPEEIETLHPTPRVALRLFHSDNIPGYTGHKPLECVNYHGECRAGCDPTTTTGDSYQPHQ
ncbi:hypothetical protein BBJ28_00012879 [Nothophytophthora sp. Chile5]|nr:hypothetical protein BBJ28_00012879 [Nothophytophthora sp. Chile5]